MKKEERLVIEVNNLVKRYGDHTAVDHLSFKIEKGKIYGPSMVMIYWKSRHRQRSVLVICRKCHLFISI